MQTQAVSTTDGTDTLSQISVKLQKKYEPSGNNSNHSMIKMVSFTHLQSSVGDADFAARRGCSSHDEREEEKPAPRKGPAAAGSHR